MKKTLLTFLFLVIVQTINAINIQELSLSQGTGNNINVGLKVTEGSLIIFNNYSYTLENNVITLTVCYNRTTISSFTTLNNEFTIENVDLTTSNYTLIVIANYSRWVDGQAICDFTNNSATTTLQFSTPLNATVSLSSDNFVKNENNLIVSPNPSDGMIEFSNDFVTKLKSIKIFDNIGRLVQSANTFNNNSINLKEFENGIYYIEFATDKEKISKKILIKK
jgi:hypothetical protein